MKSLFFHIVYGFFFIFHKIANFKFALLRDERIGHLLANTEYWLRKKSIQGIKEQKIKNTLFISSNSPCNSEALNTVSRFIRVIKSSFLKKIVLKLKSLYPASSLWECMDENGYNDPETWQNSPKQMELSEDTLNEGYRFLKDISTKNEFVCVFSRDSNYLKQASPTQNWDYHNYRDADFINYKEALDFLEKSSITSFRVGSEPSKPPVELEGRFIDYASKYRNEKLDLFLGRNCKFFLGDSSGVYYFSQTFNTPCLLVNLIPQGVSTYLLHDLFIPKKLWSKDKSRYLKFKEVYELGAHLWHRTEEFQLANLECHQNTPIEIMQATEEMCKRLDGVFSENTEIYDRYFSSIEHVFPKARMYAPIAQSFLELNQDLLE